MSLWGELCILLLSDIIYDKVDLGEDKINCLAGRGCKCDLNTCFFGNPCFCDYYRHTHNNGCDPGLHLNNSGGKFSFPFPNTRKFSFSFPNTSKFSFPFPNTSKFSFPFKSTSKYSFPFTNTSKFS